MEKVELKDRKNLPSGRVVPVSTRHDGYSQAGLPPWKRCVQVGSSREVVSLEGHRQMECPPRRYGASPSLSQPLNPFKKPYFLGNCH
jgi:hypothetical protein